MNTNIRKELRENFRWAGLIFLITFGLLSFCIHQEFKKGIPFLENTTLTVSLLMYPTAGLFIGLMQIFPDARKGRWQFVMHRPVSRSRIFFGKVIAGIILYSAATLLSLTFTAIWVATPGHVPGPFSLDMLQPVLSILMSGLVWYAVGLLIGALRRARWFGSRIMPVGIGIAGMFLAFLDAMTFVEAVGIAVLCMAILVSAACGAFIAGGDSTLIPGWAKPSIGLTVAIGWLMTVMVAAGGVVAAIETLSPPGTQTVIPFTSYTLNADGDLVVDQRNDLGGKAGTELISSNISLNDPSDLSRVSRVQTEGFLNPESHMRLLGGAWAGSWGAGARPEIWIYVVSRRTLEGYDYKTRRWVASIGPDGIIAPGQPARPFAEPVITSSRYGNQAIVISDGVVFGFDPARREIFRIFSAAPGDPVLDAKFIAHSNKPEMLGPPDQSDYVVATRNGIHIIQGTHLLATVPIEPELIGSYYVEVARNRADNIVVASGLYSSYESHHAFIYGLDGKLIRRTDKPEDAVPPPTPDPVWMEYVEQIPFPPMIFAALAIRHLWYGDAFEWLPFIRLLLVAAIYAGIAVPMLQARHARRSQFILWLIVAAALGLTGILLLMSMFEKPKSVRCQSCGKRRLVTKSACLNCHMPAPAPAMEGIEIFDPMFLPAN